MRETRARCLSLDRAVFGNSRLPPTAETGEHLGNVLPVTWCSDFVGIGVGSRDVSNLRFHENRHRI